MKLSRTRNSLRNMVWGLINKFVNIIIPFLIRTVFIYYLGVDYLGLNSLFTSILVVLNLAEMGFSNAIVYNMYRPIADNDYITINALLNFYRKVYYRIGLFITVIGILLTPFLSKFIEGDIPNDINISIIYLLYLANTSVSYFLFSYKNCIFTAYQRDDIVNKLNITIKLFMYVSQFISLIYLRNYYVYIVCLILSTIIINIFTEYYSNKYFPFFKCNGDISKESRLKIKKDIKGLVIGKLCLISRNSFDCIFLSMFLGLQTVTIYGNYYYIMHAINGILLIFMSSISAGIGNSIATESINKNYNDFKKFTFMYAWLSGWCTVCLLCLFQPFMKLWMGDNLLFPMVDVILICLYFYSLTMGDVRSQYTAASGLFWETRYYVLFEAILNIFLNYTLGKLYGVHGIIFATWFSIFFINFGWGSFILFKYFFKNFNPKQYYFSQLFYMTVISFVSFITYSVCSCFEFNSISNIIFRFLICITIPNLLFFWFFRKLLVYKESALFIEKHKNDFIKKISRTNFS